jgi:hypothetical protein
MGIFKETVGTYWHPEDSDKKTKPAAFMDCDKYKIGVDKFDQVRIGMLLIPEKISKMVEE